MHKWLPNLVAKFWLPNLVLYQTADGCDISSEIALRWTSLDLSDDKSTLVQGMAWCHQAASHYLNQCWPRSLPPYGITRPQWVKSIVNSLGPSDAIWWHRSGSTLTQVMACCLTAPSHYLNQCWLITGEVIHNYIWSISHRKCSKISILDMHLKATNFRLQQYVPGANELTFEGTKQPCN